MNTNENKPPITCGVLAHVWSERKEQGKDFGQIRFESW
jgi:hypothetical protein